MQENNSGKAITISSPFNFLSFILFIVFLILKLTGVIDWPWLYITMPIWIPIGLDILIFLVIIIVYFIGTAIENRGN